GSAIDQVKDRLRALRLPRDFHPPVLHVAESGSLQHPAALDGIAESHRRRGLRQAGDPCWAMAAPTMLNTSSSLAHCVKTQRPPGRSTRKASAIARSALLKCMTPNAQTT